MAIMYLWLFDYLKIDLDIFQWLQSINTTKICLKFINWHFRKYRFPKIQPKCCSSYKGVVDIFTKFLSLILYGGSPAKISKQDTFLLVESNPSTRQKLVFLVFINLPYQWLVKSNIKTYIMSLWIHIIIRMCIRYRFLCLIIKSNYKFIAFANY